MTAPRAAVAVLVLVAVAGGCGGSRAETAPSDADGLRERLAARDLSPRWVVCVPSRMRLRERTAFRCHVSFGDPHIQIYGAAVVGGRVRAAEWRQPVHGREDRAAFQRGVRGARRLSGGLG